MKTEEEIQERLNQMLEYQEIETTIGMRMKPKLKKMFEDVHLLDDLIELLTWVLEDE